LNLKTGGKIFFLADVIILLIRRLKSFTIYYKLIESLKIRGENPEKYL
jgi:hypothetical protein